MKESVIKLADEGFAHHTNNAELYLNNIYLHLYLPRDSGGIKYVLVLTHIQGKSFIHVGAIEGNGRWYHSN